MGIAVGMTEALSKVIHSAYKNNRFRFVYLGACHFFTGYLFCTTIKMEIVCNSKKNAIKKEHNKKTVTQVISLYAK